MSTSASGGAWYDLAGDLFIHLQRLSLRFHSRKSIGDTIRRVTVDSGCVATIVSDAVVPLLSALLSLAAMFFVMWRLDPTLTLLSLAVVPMMLAGLARYWRPMLDVSYQQQEVEGRIYSVVDETLTAMPAVQAYGAEPRADARFRATTADIVDASLAAVTVQLEFKIAIASATALGTAAILWVGAGHVIDGSLSVGSVLVFLSYLASLYGPLESLMHAPSTTQAAAGSARRVLEVLQAEREVSDKPGATALPPVRGDVRLEQVSVGYVSSRPVLHGISIEARAGETIALVGPTGAGKSTLVGLLPRFIDPWEGRVLVDGHDVRDVTLESLRGQIAIVLQEPFLFPMTIAENIAYGRPGADQLQIEAAARAANAHDFISRLPDGCPDDGGRARRHLVGRRTPAAVHCPGAAEGCADPDSRRAHERGGRRDRVAAARGPRAPRARADHFHHRASPLHDPACRPRVRRAGRHDRRNRHASRADRGGRCLHTAAPPPGTAGCRRGRPLMEGRTPAAGTWSDGTLPANVVLGARTLVTGAGAFRRFMSTGDRALSIGSDCTMDGVQFALGAEARVSIGDYCYFTNVVLLSELELRIGSYVVIGWNTTITDTDFHPIAPAERVRDAVACSPLGKGHPRPPSPGAP